MFESSGVGTHVPKTLEDEIKVSEGLLMDVPLGQPHKYSTICKCGLENANSSKELLSFLEESDFKIPNKNDLNFNHYYNLVVDTTLNIYQKSILLDGRHTKYGKLPTINGSLQALILSNPGVDEPNPYEWVVENLKNISKSHDISQIIFTGHSLGGGISTLLSCMYVSEMYFGKSNDNVRMKISIV